jgi:bile acid transporter
MTMAGELSEGTFRLLAEHTEVVEVVSRTETILLAIMMAFKDFRLALRHPRAVLIGFASQYIFMPFIAFTIAYLLGLPPFVAAGLILIGCAPGGTTSNMFAYFSRGMLSLSILMTVMSTLAAVIMVPIIFNGYTTLLGALTDEVHPTIPAGQIISILALLLVPTLIGMWTRRKNANVGAMFELVGAMTGVLVIVFLVATWVPRNWRFLLDTGPEVYVAAIGLGLFGFLIGYWFARALRMDKVKARTVSLETGIQNGPLVVLVIGATLAGIEQRDMLTVPVLYMLFIVMTSTVVTLFYRARSTREELARDQAKVETATPAR